MPSFPPIPFFESSMFTPKSILSCSDFKRQRRLRSARFALFDLGLPDMPGLAGLPGLEGLMSPRYSVGDMDCSSVTPQRVAGSKPSERSLHDFRTSTLRFRGKRWRKVVPSSLKSSASERSLHDSGDRPCCCVLRVRGRPLQKGPSASEDTAVPIESPQEADVESPMRSSSLPGLSLVPERLSVDCEIWSMSMFF